MADEPFDLIQTVVAASELLDILADAPQPISLDELAARAGVAAPRAQRQISTLAHLGSFRVCQ